MNTLIINTHGGISGLTDFYIEVNPNVQFTIGNDNAAYEYRCVEYRGQENRQCYKCALCHNIDLCCHFLCSPKKRKDGKMVKFKHTN